MSEATALPSSAQLADAIARLLQDSVLPAVPAELAHEVRVAAHLARTLERELAADPAAVAERTRALRGLVGEGTDRPIEALADRLRDLDTPIDTGRVWRTLAEITEAELALAKPGHSAWTDG